MRQPETNRIHKIFRYTKDINSIILSINQLIHGKTTNVVIVF